MNPEVSPNRELSLECLSAEPFDNLMTLKMLAMFPAECVTTLYRDESGWACLTELGAKVSAWDRNAYPRAGRIAMLDGTSQTLLAHILQTRQADSVVYKVHDRWSRAILAEDSKFSHATSFLSYSDLGQAVELSGLGETRVEQHSHYDREAAALFAASGYTTQEFRLHLERGARWFTVRGTEGIVSFCLTFPIFERIWEIGAVVTLEAYRRRGFARAVVSAALGFLKTHGLTPRYQFHYRNNASRGLAEGLGLTLRLVVDHYVDTTVLARSH